MKIEDTHITPHQSEGQTQHLNNEAFTAEGHPGQVTGFTALLHVSTTVMSSIIPTLLLCKGHNL